MHKSAQTLSPTLRRQTDFKRPVWDSCKYDCYSGEHIDMRAVHAGPKAINDNQQQSGYR